MPETNPTPLHPDVLPRLRRRSRLRPGLRLGVLALLLAVVAPEVAAAGAHLVRNIDEARRGRIRRCPLAPCPLPEPVYGSVPMRIVAFGDRVVLGADDGEHGLEPWISDGTLAGTWMLGDLNPGSGDSSPVPLVAAGGRMHFWAGGDLDGWGSWTLWSTDGTPDGTELIPLPCGGDCELPAGGALALDVGGDLYFNAFDWRLKQEVLYRSRDGLAELVRSPCPGVGSCLFAPVELVSWQGDLLLVEGMAGDGARRVLRVGPGGAEPMLAQCSSAGWLTPVGGELFFAGGCAADKPGKSLWALAPGHTVPRFVHDLGEGTPDALVRAAGGVFALVTRRVGTQTERQVWFSDGTTAGTRQVATFHAIGTTVDIGSALVVAASGQPGADLQLWRVDPQGGVELLLGRRVTSYLAADGGRVYFGALDATHGAELWRSDGTAAGTVLIADVASGPKSSNPGDSGIGPPGFAIAGERLFFAANHPDWDIELWALPLDAEEPPPACAADSTTLCLGERFRVRASWRTGAGQSGGGRAIPLATDTGAFWFFGPTNYEVVVKVLDACAPPYGRFWVFAAGLTDVEVTLTVEDAVAGKTRVYHNPLGAVFQPVQDTHAFATCP